MPAKTKNASQPNPSNGSQDTNCFSTSVDQTHPLPARSQTSEDTECITTYHDQTPLMAARTQIASQQLSSKLIHCQQGLKMYLNLCWPNSSQAGEQTKFISTCVDQTYPMLARTKSISIGIDQTPPMPARAQFASQHVLSNPLSCQLGHKFHFNIALKYTITIQQGHKNHLFIFWPNSSHSSDDKKCISTCVDL